MTPLKLLLQEGQHPRDRATKPVTAAEWDAISFSPLPHPHPPTLLSWAPHGGEAGEKPEGSQREGARPDTGVAFVFMGHSLAE